MTCFVVSVSNQNHFMFLRSSMLCHKHRFAFGLQFNGYRIPFPFGFSVSLLDASHSHRRTRWFPLLSFVVYLLLLDRPYDDRPSHLPVYRRRHKYLPRSQLSQYDGDLAVLWSVLVREDLAAPLRHDVCFCVRRIWTPGIHTLGRGPGLWLPPPRAVIV